MAVLDDETPLLPAPLDAIAARAANEGVPVYAIARFLAEPAESVYNTLQAARALGTIAEVPKPDWPPTSRNADRLPSIPRTHSDDDTAFRCRQVFHLTQLEAAFLVVLIKYDRADKVKLHYIVEQQRLARATRPDSIEMTDPKMVDVMICKLRKKLKTVHNTITITTVWGGGYYLTPEVKAAIAARLNPGETCG